MKRILALVLVLGMALSMLSGCGGSEGADTKGAAYTTKANETQAADNGGTKATEADGTESIADQGAAGNSVIDFSEDPYEVVVEVLNLGSNMDSVPEMEAAVNAITLPAINCTVRLQVIHIADHATKTALWAAGGEKIDVYYTGTTVPFTQFVSDGMIIPITELLDERGTTIKEKAGNLLEAFTINGEIYGIPQGLYTATAPGIDYNASMVEEYGLTLPETWNMETYTQLGHDLKAAAPDKYLVAKNSATDASDFGVYYNTEGFGTSTYAYGVIFNPESSTEVVNAYTSDQFKEYCKYMIEWKENGFMPADQAVSGENAQDLYRNQMLLAQWVSVTPSEAMNKKATMPFDSEQAAFGPALVSSRSLQEKSWGISVNCERPDKAMDFLNFLYENAEVANILTFGIEGKDYELVEGSDCIVTYPGGVDGSNVGWAPVFTIFGDDMMRYLMAPGTEAYYDELKTFNENAKSSATLGYSFDTSSVSTQISNVTTVVNEFVPSLTYGEIPEDQLDAYLDDLNARLDSAGINEIIEENKAQLSAWLASKN